MRLIEKPELISTILDKRKVWLNIRESRLMYMFHRKLISIEEYEAGSRYRLMCELQGGGTGNVLTGSLAEFNSALQSESFATLTGTNTLENKTFTKISIFMNVFNCHVNRTPSDGIVEEIFYKPGKFLNASLDKSSEENERNYYKIKDSNGNEIIIVQIAGLIARRIVCEVDKDQKLSQGERIGMIRFGSRVDVYSNNVKVLTKIGQNVVAGESLIAER